MGNEMTMDIKSKLENFETSRKDNDREASMDDTLDETPVHVFPYQLSPNIFKRRREMKKSHLLQQPFMDLTQKRKLLMTKTDIVSIIFYPLRPPSIDAKVAYTDMLMIRLKKS